VVSFNRRQESVLVVATHPSPRFDFSQF